MRDKPETIMYISAPPALLSNGLTGYETDRPSGHMYPDKDWTSVQNIAMCYNIIILGAVTVGKQPHPLYKLHVNVYQDIHYHAHSILYI